MAYLWPSLNLWSGWISCPGLIPEWGVSSVMPWVLQSTESLSSCIVSCGFDGRRREHGKPNKLSSNLCVTRTLCKEESRTLEKPVTEDGTEITPEREGGRKLKFGAMHIWALSHQILSHPLCAGPWTHGGDALQGLLTASDGQASRGQWESAGGRVPSRSTTGREGRCARWRARWGRTRHQVRPELQARQTGGPCRLGVGPGILSACNGHRLEGFNWRELRSKC